MPLLYLGLRGIGLGLLLSTRFDVDLDPSDNRAWRPDRQFILAGMIGAESTPRYAHGVYRVQDRRMAVPPSDLDALGICVIKIPAAGSLRCTSRPKFARLAVSGRARRTAPPLVQTRNLARGPRPHRRVRAWRARGAYVSCVRSCPPRVGPRFPL